MKFSGNTIVVSSSGGAILGGSVFGPIGALIGAAAGATVGLISSSQDELPTKSEQKEAKKTIVRTGKEEPCAY